MKTIVFYINFIMLFLYGCAEATTPKDIIPVHETFKIQSAQVGEERTINVWLPESYKNQPDSLPVMYMADGGTEEDFPHIANTLDKLIKEGKIKSIILVGIENTQRRRDLTGFTNVEKDKAIAPVVGGSEKFRAFIKQELFPQIIQRYRTTKEKSIIGESASGLFVMETFFLDPDMFDRYIAFDPSLWWNNHYLITSAKTHLSQFPNDKKVLWFAGSGTKDIAPLMKGLVKELTETKIDNLHWMYADEPKEKHNTIFRATKEKAIIWSLNQ